ncbi:hypothetical protein ANTQUA_LOCUS1508 [Anthophora quadrimaculata]
MGQDVGDNRKDCWCIETFKVIVRLFSRFCSSYTQTETSLCNGQRGESVARLDGRQLDQHGHSIRTGTLLPTTRIVLETSDPVRFVKDKEIVRERRGSQ